MKRTLIIAEAGVNHDGNLNQAKKLIDVGAEAGVDYVKFQTFKAEKLVTKSAQKANYQVENTKNSDSQFNMLKQLELSEADHIELIDYCRQKNVQFLSSGFDLDSLQFLYDLGIRIAKIPSGEITNYPYLIKVAQLFPEVILSTGMATMDEVKFALDTLINHGSKKGQITILHCNTEYPTPMKDVNLLAMNDIANQLDVSVGYSDHTLGIEVPIAAVALGGTVIEKHFTLSRELPGPDHKASLEPDELKAMVQAIRNIELAISGSGKKEPSESELKNRTIARKSIVAAVPISKGDVFTEENLSIKRPGTGIPPREWSQVIGMTAIKDFDIDDPIELN